MAEPITTFKDFKLNRQILNAIEEQGYTSPTPIQIKAIPLIIAGHDVMGVAQTGTGKTAAFVLPLIMKIKYAQGEHPRALILAPTKELVLQIENNIRNYTTYCDLRHIALYGGVGPKTQIENISEGVDIIVATPGRFLDLYLRGEINTKQIKTLVLDEADKMMDMGFMHQIRKILEVIPTKRQNLLFSATMPSKVIELSEEFLEFPETVEVTPQATTADTIEQVLYQVPNMRTKINFLVHLLNDELFNRVIVFTKTKTTADNVFKYLSRIDVGEIRVIHSNKGQNSRINAVEEFKNGNVRVLVSTDVASRGLDISLVSHVINFDIPTLYEDYVHRIGRTGRANNTGVAISLSTPSEVYHISKIEKLIRKPIDIKPLPSTIEIAKTDVAERQEMALEIDRQKRLENPDFKGAFHEKKRDFSKEKTKSSKKRNFRKGRKK
ncbi:MAG: DEAD/DEAH box helicase [Cyclobacteriaceae bacterium]|nr:DEAD/DEAH box helicase [Cyclobacteriaceae bacterium]